LAVMARGAQPPPIQLMYFGAAPLHQGESFDIACFGGVTCFHATRSEGCIAPTVVSSVHLRCVDFETSCQAANPKDKAAFEKNTRASADALMLYTATVDAEWSEEANHERISEHSFRVLQTSRQDFDEKLKRVEIDEKVPIVTLVVDCTTDHRNFHFCQASSEAATKAATKKEQEKTEATTKKDLLEELDPDEEAPSDSVLSFAMQLCARRGKDMVPNARIAAPLAALGDRCHLLGKVLHVLLTGCNTRGVVLLVRDLLAEEARSSVWVLATNTVWPGDLSTFLWHHYGSMVSVDLRAFRDATRVLLDEYTAHWRRQKVRDGSMEDHGHTAGQSLAEHVVLDRMDKVKEGDGGIPIMAGL